MHPREWHEQYRNANASAKASFVARSLSDGFDFSSTHWRDGDTPFYRVLEDFHSSDRQLCERVLRQCSTFTSKTLGYSCRESYSVASIVVSYLQGRSAVQLEHLLRGEGSYSSWPLLSVYLSGKAILPLLLPKNLEGIDRVLLEAAKRDLKHVMSFLVSHGARFSFVDEKEQNAYHWLCKQDQGSLPNDFYDLLVSDPRAACARDKDGNTPFHFACYHPHQQIVDAFLRVVQDPASLLVANNFSRTALDEIVASAVKATSSLCVPRRGETEKSMQIVALPFHAAALYLEHLQCAEVLLRQKVPRIQLNTVTLALCSPETPFGRLFASAGLIQPAQHKTDASLQDLLAKVSELLPRPQEAGHAYQLLLRARTESDPAVRDDLLCESYLQLQFFRSSPAIRARLEILVSRAKCLTSSELSTYAVALFSDIIETKFAPPAHSMHTLARKVIPQLSEEQCKTLLPLSEFKYEISLSPYFVALPNPALQWFSGGPPQYIFRDRTSGVQHYWPTFTDMVAIRSSVLEKNFLDSGLGEVVAFGPSLVILRCSMELYALMYRWLIGNMVAAIDVVHDEHQTPRYFHPLRLMCPTREISSLLASVTFEGESCITGSTSEFWDIASKLVKYPDCLVYPEELQGPEPVFACDNCKPRDPLYSEQWSIQRGPPIRPPSPLRPVLNLESAIHLLHSYQDHFNHGVKRVSVIILEGGLPEPRPPDLGAVEYHAVQDVPVTEHGRQVSEIIASEQNEVGIVGIAPRVPTLLLPVSLIAGVNFQSRLRALASIEASASKEKEKRFIVNISWIATDNRDLRESIGRLVRMPNVIVVACAGNEHGLKVAFPAKYAGVFSVAALTAGNSKYANSAFGDEIQISAPGENIQLRTEVVSGTSFATAHVTGVCALVWALRPELSATDIKKILCESAGAISDTRFALGKGFVDAHISCTRALMDRANWATLPAPPALPVHPPPPVTP